MKFNWKNCIRVGGCAFLLFLCIYYWKSFTQFLALLFHASAPLIVGCVIAYIVNILMAFYERHYFVNSKSGLIRKSRTPVCMILAFLTFVLIVALLLWLVIPELTICVRLLVAEVPGLLRGLTERLAKLEILSEETLKYLTGINWNELLGKLVETVKNGIGGTVNMAVGMVSSVVSSLLNTMIGIIFAIYLLLGKRRLKNQCSRLAKRYLRPSWNDKMRYALGILDDCFHRYIVGQCTEAVILGILCAVGMLIFRFPYATIIGAVIGFTALIPVAGAYIGGAVGILLILTVSPVKAVLFLVYLVVLQQLEGNLIYPRVVGSSLGLPGIWVLAAVTVGGGIYGVTGMLVGVPLAAAVYRMLSNDVKKGEAGIQEK